MTETRIPSGGKIPPLFNPVDIMEIGQPGMPGELIIHNGKLYIYSSTGATLIDGGIIQTGAILANSITADKLTIGSQSFTHDIVWTATDENTCSWSAGTIKWADEETSDIENGNTGDIAATTYIYYNGTDTLGTTTDFESAISDSKRLLAIVEKVDVGKCIITSIESSGTTIDGNKIVTGKIQSTDGKTYFDLNNDRLIVNDDNDDDRVLIGKK